MLIIGLTGGIGSGKSTVAELFAAQGVPIIDADIIARTLMTEDKTLTEKIRVYFGDEVMDADGKLNRTKLRLRIFANPSQRQWLEQLMHPLIIATIKWRISAIDAPYCLVVIPLLAEVPEAQSLVDRILVVDGSAPLQLQRIIQRDNLTVEQAQRVLQSQASRNQRLDLADDIIHNESTLTALEQQVLQLHQKYLLSRQ